MHKREQATDANPDPPETNAEGESAVDESVTSPSTTTEDTAKTLPPSRLIFAGLVVVAYAAGVVTGMGPPDRPQMFVLLFAGLAAGTTLLVSGGALTLAARRQQTPPHRWLYVTAPFVVGVISAIVTGYVAWLLHTGGTALSFILWSSLTGVNVAAVVGMSADRHTRPDPPVITLLTVVTALSVDLLIVLSAVRL